MGDSAQPAKLHAGMRMVDAEYKLEKNIKIAMLYLEDDDAVNAETFIKKAASLITGTKVLYLLDTDRHANLALN